MKNVNDFDFWENIYKNNDTGWDLGGVTPIFSDMAHELKPGKLIILGCGRGYDAITFAKQNFDVTAVDFAPSAVKFLEGLCLINKVKVNIIQDDIFSLNEKFKNNFDFVIEQTCFCAIDPNRRNEYEQLVYNILKYNGSLIGTWYPLDKKLDDGGPPYGVSISRLKSIFQKNWVIDKESYSDRSVRSRRGKEKLITFKKKL